MSKIEGIGKADGRPPTLEEFTAFVRKVTNVRKSEIDAKMSRPNGPVKKHGKKKHGI